MAVLFIGILSRDAIKQQMLAWDLLPKPEQITELYFTKPSSIPTTYAPARAIPISFTLHNATSSSQTYTYAVTQTNESGVPSTQLLTGKVSLKLGETKATPLQLVPTDLGARVTFDIHLTGSDNQHINFWAKKE